MIKKKGYALKGFTIAELLVVMVLTSACIALSYGTLNYIQRLFSEYRKQNGFLSEFASLKGRLEYESLRCERVMEQKENSFEIKRDSVNAVVELREKDVLVRQGSRCDTFHFALQPVRKNYERMQNPAWTNKLVRELLLETEFKKQKFSISFTKEHSASLKLELENGE